MKPIVDSQGVIQKPEGDIVLSSGPLVGCGDHAVYSTLAKRFSELGHTVYMDQDNRARNNEILELFWTSNPYIKGPTDKKPNAGYGRQGLFYEIANRFPVGSIAAMERAHGLPPPYSISPYISYKPKKYHIDFSQTVLFDFSAVSSRIDLKGIQEFMRAMKGKFRNAPFVQLLMPKWAALHPPLVRGEAVQVDSIYEYLDMLAGCRGWIGSEAGGQSLAAAIRGEHPKEDFTALPEISVLMTPQTFNDQGYVYSSVDYRVTNFGQDKESDWHFPHEMNQHIYEQRCAMSLEQMRARA